MAAILAVVAVVVLSGVKASAKFAEYIAAAELAALTAVSIYFLWRSGFKLYNPLAGLALARLGRVVHHRR